MYRFPRYVGVEEDFDEQLLKLNEELTEVKDAWLDASCVHEYGHLAEELFDLIHAAETALRMLEGATDIEEAYFNVIRKNYERSYYAE